jgi:hypothetical protein
MAFNNNLLYNAAYAAFISGVMTNRNPTSQTATNYLDLTQRAQAFATRVDSKIANNALISAGGGAAVPPTTAAITEDESAFTLVLFGICSALVSQRDYTSETAADYDSLALVAAAQFTEALLLVG